MRVPRGRLEYPVIAWPAGAVTNIFRVALGSTETLHNEQHSIYRLPGESDAAFTERAQDFAHGHLARFGFDRPCRIEVCWATWTPERMQFEDRLFNFRRAALNEKLDGWSRRCAAVGLIELWQDWLHDHPEDA
jgi:hypothetical protein